MLRPYQSADLDQLTCRGIPVNGERRVFVLERDGVVAGALSASPRSFESEWLGLEVFQIDAIEAWADEDALTEIAGGGLAMLRDAGADLVACRRAEEDRSTLAALQQAGMAVIECLQTFGRSYADLPAAPSGIDMAAREDADQCARIAERTFRCDRFHADPMVDDGKADALKGAWARNSVAGRADRVFVSRAADRITGFNACLLSGDTAVIDLIAVDPDCQGQGLGRALVAAALHHYAGPARHMVVGTQSSNYGSLALYQGMGFRVEKSALTLHAHLS